MRRHRTADVKGALLNVTLVQGGPGGGYVTVFPANLTDPPGASTVNPSTGIAASAWASGLPTISSVNPGALSVTSISGPRDVIIDVLAEFR